MSKSTHLTRAEARTDAFIRKFHAEHERAPTRAEIAAGTGIESRGVVQRYVNALEKKGRLRLLPNCHFNIELVKPGSNTELPLLGRIAAGQPIEAIPNRDSIDIANIFLQEDRYALQVKGDSMIEEGILDGDIVVCQRSDYANDGQIVVALVDEQEATLKRFKRNQNDMSVTLIPANAKLTPMTYEADRVRVQGVFVGLLRFLSP